MESFIKEISGRGIRPGLARMRCGLAALGDPHQGVDVILVAGTNGKGTVAKTLETMARSSGATTFLFTSPHLVHLEERYRFDGVQVSPESLEACHRRCLEVLPEGATDSGNLTPFEWMTLVGFALAHERKPDLWILEAGLGGRLDSTNCVDPVVSVVTSIGLDHTDRLGSDLESIAWEKSGVFRDGVPAIVGATAGKFLSSDAYVVEGRDFAMERIGDGTVYRSGDNKVEVPNYGGLAPSIRDSFAVACAAMEAWVKPSADVFSRAVEAATRSHWPGRVQVLRETPLLIVDGAHNPDGARWLARELTRRYPATRFHAFFGAKDGKDWLAMMEALEPVLEDVTLVSDLEGYLLPAREMFTAIRDRVDLPVSVAHESLDILIRRADSPAIVAGSLYLVGEAISALGLEANLVRLA